MSWFLQDMRLFLDNFRQEFRFADSKPHVLFAGRMEGDLMAGCGQKTTSSSGFTVKVSTSRPLHVVVLMTIHVIPQARPLVMADHNRVTLSASEGCYRC